MTIGTCGCKLCGLRGYSKNVKCRSVFPTFEGLPILLESYERQVTAHEKDGRMYFSTTAQDWSKDDAPEYSFAEFLINFLKSPDATPEHLKIVLCIHEWVQDPGTETV